MPLVLPQSIQSAERSPIGIEKIRDSFFILFLLAGVFKATPQLQFFNFDLTIVFVILSFALTFFTADRRILRIPKFPAAYAVLFFLFATFAFFSLVYANTSTDYSLDKALRFLFLGGWAVIGSLFLLTEGRLLWFTKAYGFCALIIAIDGIVIFFTNPYPGVSAFAFSSSYLVLGQVCSSALPIFLANAVLSHGFWGKSYYFAGTVLLITAIILSASRGPILSLLLVTVCAPLFLGQRVRQRLGVWLVFALAVLVLVVLASVYSPTIFNYTMARFAVLENNIRTSLYADALQIWEAHPVLGVGIGNYLIYNSNGVSKYPHNIILESLAELGLIGGFFVVLLLCIPIFLFFQQQAWRKPAAAILLMMFLTTVFNSMFSGDFNDNRTLLVLAVLVITSVQLPAFNVHTLGPTEPKEQ